MRFKKRSGLVHGSDLRPSLFGNVDLVAWPSSDGVNGYPWDEFVRARDSWKSGDREAAVSVWDSLAHDEKVESRHRLQAWHFLRSAGEGPSGQEAMQVFGVIAEVAVAGGHDLLAAYLDGSARYINHAGGTVVVDASSAPDLAADVESWLAVGAALARVIGAWEGGVLPPLPTGHTRIVVLTPGGIRFGQGPDGQLRQDATASPFLEAATQLMVQVTRRASI